MTNAVPQVPRLGMRRGGIVFFILWLTFAGVHHPEPGWNVNSRFALTQALVDKGTFCVSDYVNREDRDFYTEDRAFKDGRYYSDKIIGASLLGVPAYALAKFGAWLCGAQLSPALARYLTTIGSVGVCAALAGTVAFSLLLAFGATLPQAFLLTLAMSFGTMLWSYSSLFFSYLPSVFFLLVSYNVLLRARLGGLTPFGPSALLRTSELTASGTDTDRPGEDNLPQGARLGGGIEEEHLFRSGLAMGMALLCEYTAGIVAIALSIYVLIHTRPRWKVLAFWLAACLPLSIFAFYTLACFGELCVPYKYLEKMEFVYGMRQGVQGIAQFQWPVLYYITVHPFRGLFVLSPMLALSILGLARMAWKDTVFRWDAAMCGGIFLAYLIFNSSYYMWWGGWTMGPRHLIPSLPFLIPPLLWVLRWNRAWAVLLTAAVVASIWLTGVPALADPQIPYGPIPQYYLYHPKVLYNYPSSVFQVAWPAFFHGFSAFNRATPYPLRGPWYFLILSLAWTAGTMAILRMKEMTSNAELKV